MYSKLKITNPGHDRVGKISKDGHPLVSGKQDLKTTYYHIIYVQF